MKVTTFRAEVVLRVVGVILALLILAAVCRASDVVEVRSSSSGEYRYMEWMHTFNKVATDIYYVGVPGNNELDVCLGYQIPSRRGLSVTPFFCGVTAKENRQLGVKTAAAISWEKGKWKGDAYYGHFLPLRGNLNSYDVLDSGNATYVLSKCWEVGISTGFFRQDGKWNPLVGPLARRNDKLGSWSVSFRTGPTKEFRVIRTITLKR